MQPKFPLLFIKPTASNDQKMVPAVALALSLMTATFALPVTPEGQVATEIQGAPQKHEEIPTQQVEKVGYQGQIYEQVVQQNVPVPKVESVPVGVENAQQSYVENPVLLPIQPLSVVPVNQPGQVLRPVVVPAEAIATGRVIIMGLEPIQQRSLQDVVPEKPQIIQPLIYTPVQGQVEPNQQSYEVQTVEKQTQIQQSEQTQVQPNEDTVVQRVETYSPLPQVYNVQNPVQQNQIQKQVPYQQAVPTQEVQQQYQQAVRPADYENVEKQGQQVYNEQYNAQQRQLQVNQPVEQVYNAQPVQEQQQVYNVQPVEQNYNVQPSEKQGYEQQQQQVVENPRQQPVQTGEAVPVQQVYVAVGEIVNPIPYQQQQVSKTAEVQQHQVENYAAQPPYNYGEKLPQQNNPAHAQTHSVRPPSVVSAQE